MDDNKHLNEVFLAISENNTIIARGVWLPDCTAYLDDDNRNLSGYPDTGVFILLKGSAVRSAVPERIEKYVSGGITTKAIAFQSRSYAAQFVLGKGDAGCWK